MIRYPLPFSVSKVHCLNILASLYLWTLSLELWDESTLHWYDLSQSQVKEQDSIW